MTNAPEVRRLRWVWLLGLVGVGIAVFSRSPSTTTLQLELGNARANLRVVELSCEDDEGLSSGGRWGFEAGAAPAIISHALLTKGTQLACEITLRSERDSSWQTRETELLSDRVRLPLGAAVAALR